MKKILYSTMAMLMVMLVTSCEKPLANYDGKATIYFNETARLPKFQGEVIKDSTIVSFGLAKATDSIITMVITTSGAMMNEDRPYKLVASPASTAIAGTHYEILNQTFSIKKNKTLDTVKIKLFRTPDMQVTNFLLSFDLQDNDHFATLMNNKVINTAGKKHSFVTYRWFVNDMIKQPATWFDSYLGKFSRKKLYLMTEVLGIDLIKFETSIPLAELLAYGKFMQRYLNEQRVTGNTILDEDGSVMVMGSSVQ